MAVTNLDSLTLSGALVVAGETIDENTLAMSGLTASAAELNILEGATLDVDELNKLDGVDLAGYFVQMQEVTFTQTAGDGTYTGTMTLPAGSRIIDIGCDAQVLWAGGTSASLIVGDGADPDGFFTATDLYATDLLQFEINNIEHPGGKAGAYIVSEQRKLYQATARDVIAVVTQVGAGTAGRTRVYVVYATPTAVAATKA